MKILLINPNTKSEFPQPPLGLAILASVIRSHGDDVEIIDANALRLNETDVIKKAIESNAELVGITAMTSSISMAENLAGKIKEADASKKILLGGPHVSVYRGNVLEKNKDIDFVIFGEGEKTIVELIDAIKSGEFDGIKGLAYRKGNKVITNEPREHLKSLDEIPMPAYDLLPVERYRPYPPHGKRLPFMSLMTSRGCPFNCLFCYKDLFGRNYITKSSEKVIEEIKYLVNSLGIREIMFYDDTFTYNRERILKLCDGMIENGLTIPWSCETRVNLVDKDLLEKMKEAGCYIISYGIEAGNQRTLNILRKGTTIEQSEKAIKLTHEAGIMTVGYFIIGNPDETQEDVQETIEFAKKLNPDFVQFSICTPIPGSDLYKLAIEKGMKPNESLAYVASSSDSTPFMLTDDMTREELRKWYSKAYKEFYLRPAYLIKILSRMKSVDDMKININGLKILLNMLR